jgi:hypothetical protein
MGFHIISAHPRGRRRCMHTWSRRQAKSFLLPPTGFAEKKRWSNRKEEMVQGELEASDSERVEDHYESDSICETSPQALGHEDFDGTDATEYAAAQEPEKLVELMMPAWAIKLCSVKEFDRVLKRV